MLIWEPCHIQILVWLHFFFKYLHQWEKSFWSAHGFKSAVPQSRVGYAGWAGHLESCLLYVVIREVTRCWATTVSRKCLSDFNFNGFMLTASIIWDGTSVSASGKLGQTLLTLLDSPSSIEAKLFHKLRLHCCFGFCTFFSSLSFQDSERWIVLPMVVQQGGSLV